MERAYQFPVFVRFKVSADNAADADRIADEFARSLAGWIDGGLGSPPFAPWLTAWTEDEPESLDDVSPDNWGMRPVTRRVLDRGALWGLDENAAE
jgi:hypothetical protein